MSVNAGQICSRWHHDRGVLRRRDELILDGIEFANGVDIQIVSDLHIEGYARQNRRELDQLVIPKAPVLALLGDIGVSTHSSYHDFLNRQAEKFHAVLVLSGNHEFYNIESLDTMAPPPRAGLSLPVARTDSAERFSMQEMEAKIEAVCAEHPRLHYVDNTCVRFGNAPNSPALLCSPLWSDIPEDAMDEVRSCMNDYYKIYTHTDDPETELKDWQGRGLRALHPRDTSQFHAMAASWLQSELERLERAGCNAIGILTHHAPSLIGTSHPKYERSAHMVRHAFATDLSHLYKERDCITFWAYGHTHYNNRLDHNSRLVSNQCGYRDFVEPSYSPNFCISLSCIGRALVQSGALHDEEFETLTDCLL